MSFDIAFLRYQNGRSATIDRESVRAILRRHRVASSQFDEGSYEVRFDDGSYVEIFAPALEGTSEFDGFGAGFRSMTDSVVTFLFEFARACDLVIGVETDDEAYILVDSGQRRHLPSELDASVTECTSAQGLAQALSGGYGEWSDYRDQISAMMTVTSSHALSLTRPSRCWRTANGCHPRVPSTLRSSSAPEAGRAGSQSLVR